MLNRNNNSVFSYLKNLEAILLEAGIESYKIDALVLMQYFFDLSKSDIFLSNQNIDNFPQEKINKAIARRIKGEPISHIIGKREFYSIDFKVSKDVLDPRADSEILIEEILKISTNFSNKKDVQILELGVGSGCLLLTILYHLKNANALAVDINPKSLKVAQENAQNLALLDRVEFMHSDWFSNINTGQKFDLIISNPPYIKTSDISSLQTEVKDFEPILALDGGQDGLDCYRNIAADINNFLSQDAFVILEIGQNQEQDVIAIFEKIGLKFLYSSKDLNSIIRCLIFVKQ